MSNFNNNNRIKMQLQKKLNMKITKILKNFLKEMEIFQLIIYLKIKSIFWILGILTVQILFFLK